MKKKTPVSMRPHIGIFGIRNAGKSSLINAVTGQQTAIVSETAGTTTDPVGKAMEILPLGPVFILDTAGLDDAGELGEKRIKKSLLALKRTDLILLVTTIEEFGDRDKKFIEEQSKLQTERKPRNIVIVFNKSDLPQPEDKKKEVESYLKNRDIDYIFVSAKTGDNIRELRLKIAARLPEIIGTDMIIGDLISNEDIVVQLIPIDSAAPKGRIILPQEQVLREALDKYSISVVIQPQQLELTLAVLNQKPSLVITDSQAIGFVAPNTPDDIPLTTYSIVFSRLKGELIPFVEGLSAISNLQDGDKVMIAEACTHHTQPDDIGRVKIPKWLKEYTGKELEYVINPGKMIHQDISDIKMIIQCGGCMINRKEMLSRIELAKENNIPITNYGIIISHLHNSLQRAIKPFPDAYRTYCEVVKDVHESHSENE